MQSNFTLGRFTRAQEPNGHPKELSNVSNVMVVYQDAPTRKWATNFYPAKVKGCDEVKCTWWNLNDLSEPGVLAGAVSTAIRADVIVVAVLTGTGLPLPFYVWVDSWLPHRKLTEGKLIALVGLAKERRKEGDSGRAYLREMARQGHLNLIERDCRLPARSSDIPPEKRTPSPLPRLACRQDFGKICPAPATLWLD
jgi:hypothetical protein